MVSIQRHPPFLLNIDARVGAAYVAYLGRYLRRARKQLQAPLSELSVALVSDVVMSDLHQAFLGVTGPTDVLTFELEHDSRGRVISGEIVVCVPEARRQAQLRKTAVRQELLLYALHGMLHLCGFDDRTDAGYRRMHRKEDQILTQLGVGPVFAGDGGRRSGKSKDR